MAALVAAGAACCEGGARDQGLTGLRCQEGNVGHTSRSHGQPTLCRSTSAARTALARHENIKATEGEQGAPAAVPLATEGLPLLRNSPLVPPARGSADDSVALPGPTRRGVSGADRLRFREAGATPGDSTFIGAGLSIPAAAGPSPEATHDPPSNLWFTRSKHSP